MKGCPKAASHVAEEVDACVEREESYSSRMIEDSSGRRCQQRFAYFANHIESEQK
ncbi:hypothetical protein [Paenibacillus sp. 2TAB19]|uniref:hypothetical protein n=1 Tax=Paenibacillus sp. 2TAB19 TaxID=3233003 RepID=UPI003F94FCDD